jgi:hypothetical protein
MDPGSEYKRCTMCGHSWPSLGALLDDPAVALVGYQANFVRLELGLILFNHERCGTTFALEAGRLRHLHEGPVWKERRTGLDDCEGHCLSREVLDLCGVHCECAWVREVLAQVRRRLALARAPAEGAA